MDESEIAGRHQLRSCLWELTLRCNMHCMHCGSIAGRARSRELLMDECYRVAEEIVGLGCSELTFIGGEIFLYKGWEQLARYASDRNVLVNIMTNAYGLREEQVRQIQYARLKNVGISLDGLEQTHNLIRGKKDSFSRIIEAFHLLNREQIPIAVVTSVMELNYPDLEALYRLLVDHGVKLWQLQLVNPMGNMAGRKHLILHRTRIPSLIEFIQEKRNQGMLDVLAADSVGYFFEDSECYIRGRRHAIACWEGCQAGITGLFIDSVGNVKGCGALYDERFIEGNVRERSLKDIWLDDGCFAYNRRFQPALLSGKCDGCDVAEACRGGCRASNYFNTGKLYENAYCPHNQSPQDGMQSRSEVFVIV